MFDKNILSDIISRNGNMLISALEEIQEYFRYLPEEALREVAKKFKMKIIDVYSVATFYHLFNFTPRGRINITVCLGTACHIRGGQRIAEIISRRLGIMPGETTKDMEFSLETVNCLGACALGPIVVISNTYFGNMTQEKASSLLNKYISNLPVVR